MIDRAALRVAVGPRKPGDLEFVPERGSAFAPVRAGESEELPRDEVPRMQCHKVEKTRFALGVAERLDRGKLCLWNVHSAKISAVILCLSRIRRRREASSRKA